MEKFISISLARNKKKYQENIEGTDYRCFKKIL